ncbi:MAG: hypothetical protein R3234_10625, partial [Thermoanaerobaculia bacterium]|nr:hypothetical protein [Thermoanaerobaculia bacterium]
AQDTVFIPSSATFEPILSEDDTVGGYHAEAGMELSLNINNFTINGYVSPTKRSGPGSPTSSWTRRHPGPTRLENTAPSSGDGSTSLRFPRSLPMSWECSSPGYPSTPNGPESTSRRSSSRHGASERRRTPVT